MSCYNISCILEIHGYSISNAALMVTAPPDISLMILGYLSAWAGDIALNLDVPAHIVRRAGTKFNDRREAAELFTTGSNPESPSQS